MKNIFLKIDNNLKTMLSKVGIRKLSVIFLLAFSITLIGVFATSTYKTRYKTIYTERIEKLKYVGDFANEVLQHENELVLQHKKTLQEAQNDAISIIKDVRFENNDYIWINNDAGVMLYHPYKEKIGTNVITYVDKNHYYFGKRFIEISKGPGSGYVQYYWPKINMNKNLVYPKVSYVCSFKPWGWIIGTGLYTDDIRTKVISSMVSGLIPVCIAIFLMILLFRFVIFKTTVIPIEELAEKSIRIANNDLDVEIPEGNTQTEIGHLYTAFHQFVKTFEEKRDSEKKLSLIHNNIADVLLTIDQKGIIKSANPAIEEVFGYTQREITGMNIDSITVPAIFRPKAEDIKQIKYINGKYELLGKKKNDSTIFIELSLNEIFHENDFLHILLIRDITSQKEMEKMKDEFISIVSHELRTPLTSMRGSLGLLVSGIFPEVTGKIKDLTILAHNNCLRLIDIINDILDIEKMAAGKMTLFIETAEIKPMLDNIIEMNTPYAEKFDIKYVFDSKLPENTKIKVDRSRFNQIITNLLSNATKFSPTGEEVVIRTESSGNKIKILIIDKGPGIPKDFESKIFNKFCQADSSDSRQKGGTGLGLNISKSLIEQMGGEITFETKEGEGTTFVLYFNKIPI